jgi:hypothetical protein
MATSRRRRLRRNRSAGDFYPMYIPPIPEIGG